MSVDGSLGNIKPAEFARAGEQLAGRSDAAGMSRLREQLAEAAGQDNRLDYAIRGEITERGHDALRLNLEGMLSLVCQRCLAPVRVSLASSRRIIFAAQPSSVDAEYDADDSDVVEAVAALDVATLIEDEVLLSLPLAPMHAPGECGVARASTEADEETGRAPPKASPFAVLARLVPGKGESDPGSGEGR